ncbi:malate synthase, glyoxysomal-like, partial [Aphidius gifuensis]
QNVFINLPPKNLENEFNNLLTNDAIEFLVNLIVEFDERIDNLYNQRQKSKSEFKNKPKIPRFKKLEVNDDWQVAPVCERLKNRHVDLGDVSPSNMDHFSSALKSNVQGIQVDFDDGHCPTWYNQILGLHNVTQVVKNNIPGVPNITEAPILVLRPRAWNMIETNMSINGKNIPGSLFDYGLLIYHNGIDLQKLKCGPAFYLSKIENSNEAKLWNDIFSWSEIYLNIPHGSIKACVLIENILASFEMEYILFELKDHSLGLNCGIWDYAASIISKFGNDKSFILPDRNKYVNMNKKFLKKYMQLVVKICHKHGAHATGGMAAKLLPDKQNSVDYLRVLHDICDGKLSEINEGVDGFMIYDIKLVCHMNDLWKNHGGPFDNQINYPGTKENISEEDLMSLPKGGVTMTGLDHNICVAILFIYHWLNGNGHFIHNGSIEDSATAEISRSQIWQWNRHSTGIEDSHDFINKKLIKKRVDINLIYIKNINSFNYDDAGKLSIAVDLFYDLIYAREFPEFITSYIYNVYPFKKIQSHL